jgi:hypothetical protein
MNNRNEVIVQLLYRRLKGLEITREEQTQLQDWIDQSDTNQQTAHNLADENWLKQAREKYYAPGKEKGLQQLRERLIADRPIDKTEGRLFRWLAFLICFAVAMLALAFAFYSK